MEVRLASHGFHLGSKKGTSPCAWETGEFGLKCSSVYLEAHNWGLEESADTHNLGSEARRMEVRLCSAKP